MLAYTVIDLAFDQVSRSSATVLRCRTTDGEAITLVIDYRLLVPLASEVTSIILTELGVPAGPTTPEG